MANVQISMELFKQLCMHHIGMSEDPELVESIRVGLNAKLDALVARELYSKSKAAATPEEREAARQQYLDLRGIHPDFRW